MNKRNRTHETQDTAPFFHRGKETTPTQFLENMVRQSKRNFPTEITKAFRLDVKEL